MSRLSVQHFENKPKELFKFGFKSQITSLMRYKTVSENPAAHFQFGFGISAAGRAGQARRARVKMDSISPSSEGKDVVHVRAPRAPGV
jgi:hypothetical protein